MKIRRKIKRIAFLQEYANRPAKLLELIPEVAAKGYAAAAFAARIGQEQFLTELAAEAARHGLEVMAFTGFMKYQQDWLKDHPEQAVRTNTDAESVDQDKVSVFWGCPFNPGFQERYFKFLAALGAIPNMTEVWVNDEAYLGFGPDKLACYCPVCAGAWADEFGGKIPRPPFRDPAEKARFVTWRFRRWNAVHAEMKLVLCRDHAVRAVFLTSPACCVGNPPWITGVDLASMADGIDGIMTDPYYTFHENLARYFRPREVYLSECCRILAGACGNERQAEICAQGFSHGTFTRPLDERDGWWAGIVPAALGINAVTAYTYALQRISPMQKTYEKSFKLDRYFNRVQPCDFIGVVSSLETQCFHLDGAGDKSWMVNCLLPVTEMLRHGALPYTYVPSARLDQRNRRRFPVMILPLVTCMGDATRAALRDYVEQGGILIAFGETATRDAGGRPAGNGAWLEDVFGVRGLELLNVSRRVEPAGEQPAFAGLPWPDEVTGAYSGGAYFPALGLDQAVRIAASAEADVIARWRDDIPGPAITRRVLGAGRAIFVAGLPGRNFYCPETRLSVLNFIGYALGNLIMQHAGGHLPLRINHFTADIPMFKLRPVDPRLFPTAEFMPCAGEYLYLATIATYFREFMRFELEAILPEGKQCRSVRELVSNRPVRDLTLEGGRVVLNVALTPADCMRVYAFELR